MIKKFQAALSLITVFASGLVWTDETTVKKAVETFVGGTTVDGVRKTPYLGLYEVRMNNEVVYTDENVTYIFAGNLIETKTHRNITQARLRELSAIKFSDLPLDLAVKTVRGSGRRIIATFEDPNCTYCKHFAKELTQIDDLTIYTFLMPILSENSTTKAHAVWCSKDRSKVWNDLMLKDTAPAAAPAGCASPIEQIKQLGQKLRINGTPTLFLVDGQRIPGMVQAKQLEQMLKAVETKSIPK